MRKIQKLTTKMTIGHSFTTTDLVSFESDIKKGLIRIEDMGQKHDSILLDLTEETTFLLMEFFRYVHNELKESSNDQIKAQ